jgi:hypothetical protein
VVNHAGTTLSLLDTTIGSPPNWGDVINEGRSFIDTD